MYFENFQNDTVDSLVFRYPGTTIYTDSSTLNTLGLPLAQGATNNQYSTFTPTFTPSGDVVNIVLLFQDNGSPRRAAFSTINVCNLVEITQDENEVVLTGPNNTGTAIPILGTYITPNTKSISLKIDIAKQLITIMVGKQTVTLNRKVDWALTYNPLLYVKGDPAFRYGTFPSNLSLFVITGTLATGMLDPETLEVRLSTLQYVDSTDMGYTTTGYNEDIMGNDPLRSDPAVYAPNEVGSITYTNNLPATPSNKTLLTQQLYLGGRSPTQNPLYVNTEYVTHMENRPKAVPPKTVSSNEFVLEFKE